MSIYRQDQLEPVPESIWGKGPVEEAQWDPSTSILGSPLSITTEEEGLILGEDEIAAWLNYPINPADNRAGLNRQTVAGSSNLPQSMLLETAQESDCQVLHPVLPGKDANSDYQLDLSEMISMYNEKAGASDSGVVTSKGKAKSGFEGHNELMKQDSLTESKLSTIGSDEKRKTTLPQSMSSRKPRTTEVHNLSERRRRSRINEKMKALKELMPRSNKLDKASILDESIAYVKFLQKQVKMLSRRCAMRPQMFPTYMPSFGIGMGMDMNRAMCMQPGMTSCGPAIPCPNMNQSVQALMLQMLHQNDMAVEMLPCPLDGGPYHFPNVVSGQVEVSPQDLKFFQ